MSVVFISFSTCKYFALFELIILLKLIRLVSKSDFVTKSDYASLAAKFFAVNLLNSWVVIYLS